MINSVIPNAKVNAPAFAHRAIAELAPSPQNARTHPKAQIEKIKRSIEEFGFLSPVIVDAGGTIIAGHGRVEAAKALGLLTVPCVLADHLTDDQRRAYMLADNRIALDGGYDEAILAGELDALFTAGFDLDLTGFDRGELDALMAAPFSGLTEEDDIPEAPATPISKLGDVWVLDGHRVMCGDSTDAVTVARLLNGTKPNLMVTDPPYGVEYDADFRNGIQRADGSIVSARAIGKVMNDDRADWTDAWKLFPGDVAYVWHASMFGDVVIHSLEQAGFERRCNIIWNKNQIAIGRGHYHWKHEPCWYAVRKGGTGNWQGDRKQSSVWDIDKPQKSETGHSTQKPVECMRRPIINNSSPGQLVYDPFLGSGTTVIAAESEGRICYGMELNPAYVDVIVKRWQAFTGKVAVLESTGTAFAEAA